MKSNQFRLSVVLPVLLGMFTLAIIALANSPSIAGAQVEEPAAINTFRVEKVIDVGPPASEDIVPEPTPKAPLQEDSNTLDSGPAPVSSEEIETAPDHLVSSSAAAAFGTSFTYQGRLTDNAAPANGIYDLAFGLFTQGVGGAQLASTVYRNDVMVTDGFFTVDLDFGDSVFQGDPRYLEIQVRPGDSVDAYNVITPRQELTPTPYALYAANAGLLDGKSASSFATANHNHDSRYARSNRGLQYTGTLNPGEVIYVFTWGWPNNEFVSWGAYPITRGGRVEYSLGTERANDNNKTTYWIRVENVGTITTDYELRYVRFR